MTAVARLALALVWLHQGMWCKVLGHAPSHRRIVAAVPFVGSAHARAALTSIGTLECAIGIWVLTGRDCWQAALAQTILLAAMNAGALLWTPSLVSDRAAMVLQNFAFVCLAWMVAP